MDDNPESKQRVHALLTIIVVLLVPHTHTSFSNIINGSVNSCSDAFAPIALTLNKVNLAALD